MLDAQGDDLKNKTLRSQLAMASFTPVLVPGLIFYSIIYGYGGKAFILILVLAYGLFLFRKYSKFFFKTKGFAKRFVWSILLVNFSMVVLTFAPEANNAFAGAALFLFLPSLILSANLLSGNKISHRVAMHCKKGQITNASSEQK